MTTNVSCPVCGQYSDSCKCTLESYRKIIRKFMVDGLKLAGALERITFDRDALIRTNARLKKELEWFTKK